MSAVASPAPSPLVSGRLTHIPALDGVRGLAVLMVMAFHFRGVPLAPTLADRLLNAILALGWAGVDLFFVLSGFLITGILLDGRTDPHFFRNFYIRRSLRIFPPYYLTLIILFLVLPRVLDPVPGGLRDLMDHQAWYWTYTLNIGLALHSFGTFDTGHFWSLAVEEQFYLLWPWVVYRATQTRLLAICGGAIALALLLRLTAVALHANVWFAYAMMPMRLDGLALGATVAIFSRSISGSARLRQLWRPALLLALTGIGVVAIWHHGFGANDRPVLTVGLTFTAVASAALITALLARPELAWLQGFNMRWLRWVGRRSYGAYIYHRPIGGLCSALRPNFHVVPRVFGSAVPETLCWIAFLAALTFTAAALSYRIVELPFLRLKKRFAPEAVGA